MNSIYNIKESILDDADAIISKAEPIAELKAAAVWLHRHGCDMAETWLDWYNKGFSGWEKYLSPKTHEWTLIRDTITITDKDKDIPEGIRIKTVGSLSIQGWKGKTLPLPNIVILNSLSIRNCPNLTTLEGCPYSVEKFSVSGCPKITSLQGAPKQVFKLFKVLNNGAKFSDKDIKKVCRVDKKNMIYDA